MSGGVRPQYIPLGGGVDGTSPVSAMNPGRLRIGINVECKPGGGYRRVTGYEAFSVEVPGAGPIRGVWYFKGKVYAFRNAADNATCSMWSSNGGAWTEVKSDLAPNGSYEFVTYAFSGTQKMYGVSGKHQAFEFDGATWNDIATGMAVDMPNRITAHKKHLFLAFDNSVQHSSLGDPLTWLAVTGAGEILLDHSITGFSILPNGALGIHTGTGTTLLSGTSAADWVAQNTVEYSNNAGALPGTIQNMGANIRFTDSRGITDFGASQTSADFYDAIISHDMDKSIEGRWVRAISSTIVREKNQYRLFFNDGSGLICVFAGQSVMITQIQWPHVVRCVCNSEDASGSELIYFGSDDGYVYQMENGRTFGGQSIKAVLDTAFSNLGFKSVVKRFRRMRCDVGKNGNPNLNSVARYYIGSEGIPLVDAVPFKFSSDSGKLGSAVLGQTPLGGVPIDDGTIEIEGRGEWVSFRFISETTTDLPWELDGITVEFLLGRQRR